MEIPSLLHLFLKLKKRIMNKFPLLVVILLLPVFISSCSSGNHHAGSAYPPMDQLDVEMLHVRNEGELMSVDKKESFANVEKSERKILFSAFMTLAVAHPDTANSRIEEIAEKYKGYVNQAGSYQTIIRVKSDQLNQAIEEISLLGKVRNKSLSGQDVTEEFLDYQIRLDNAEKARSRYLELLAKAENVESALLVEKELERLNETIDLLKGKMNRINHLSEYSTITIDLKERKKPGVIGYIGMGLYYSVKWLFVRN